MHGKPADYHSEFEGIAVWRHALHSVSAEFATYAIERYDVDVDTTMADDVDDHPLISLLFCNDSLYLDRISPDPSENAVDDERRHKLARLINLILSEDPYLLGTKHGMTVADQAVMSNNTRAVAQIILLSILQSITLGIKPYQFNTDAIFADQDVSRAFPARREKVVAAMTSAHETVQRWLHLQGNLVERELMTRHRDKIGFWLQPFIPPSEPKTPQTRPSPQ